MKTIYKVIIAGVFLLMMLVLAHTGINPATVKADTCTSGGTIYASSVISSRQGVQRNGAAIPAYRSNPASALGSPDSNFFSLGFGGTETVSFSNTVNSITVRETNYAVNPAYYLEQANVEVSSNGVNFASVGTANNKSSTAVTPTTFQVPAGTKYVRLTDFSQTAGSDPTSDGFDFESVSGVQSCPAPVCTPNVTKQCVGNAVYWFDSCNVQGDIFQQCTANQICQNGACVNQTIICSTNAQCGTNGYTGSPFCQLGNVYQNYITHTCNNPGTASSYCSEATAAQPKQACGLNETCSAGICVQNIACSTDAHCGTNSLTGNPFCQGNNVYRNQLTYHCNNPGASDSFCSSSLVPQLIKSCGTNKTCVNGDCASQNIACGSNADCGSNGLTGNAFCQNGGVYKNYITYSCNNPGTSQAFCSSSLTPQLTQTCSTTQNCVNGSCTSQNIACTSNTQCGANVLTGSPFCQSGNVYQNYITYTCNNPGTASSSCTNSTDPQLKTTCSADQTCTNGACVNQTQTCEPRHNSQKCNGNNLYWYDACNGINDLIQNCPNGCSGNSCQNYNNNISVQTNSATNVNNNNATLNGYLYNTGNNNNCATYVWFQYGPTASYGSETAHQTQNYSGNFSQIVTLYNNYNNYNNSYHFRAAAQSCSGNVVYGQDMITASGNNTGALIVNKTVKNISTNSGFSSSVNASPLDMLMFMITVQSNNGQDVQNIVVRDYLPANLIYNNQLVISGTNNYYNNYSGNITSGISLNTISAGQTVTITYQAQVAGASNFSYGTTTLNNNVTVTSSNSGYTPASNATIFVTRTAVYGASYVSTGLTNNFWVDSFFLPLLITLILLWIWKSGMLFGIEKWLINKKKAKQSYSSEKELATRIALIQKTERA